MNKYGIIFVVETNNGKAFMGSIKRTAESVTVYNGFAGRPPVIPVDEVDSITPAHDHPDVVKL